VTGRIAGRASEQKSPRRDALMAHGFSAQGTRGLGKFKSQGQLFLRAHGLHVCEIGRFCLAGKSPLQGGQKTSPNSGIK